MMRSILCSLAIMEFKYLKRPLHHLQHFHATMVRLGRDSLYMRCKANFEACAQIFVVRRVRN